MMINEENEALMKPGAFEFREFRRGDCFSKNLPYGINAAWRSPEPWPANLILLLMNHSRHEPSGTQAGGAFHQTIER
jgi:hypothetical protein